MASTDTPAIATETSGGGMLPGITPRFVTGADGTVSMQWVASDGASFRDQVTAQRYENSLRTSGGGGGGVPLSALPVGASPTPAAAAATPGVLPATQFASNAPVLLGGLAPNVTSAAASPFSALLNPSVIGAGILAGTQIYGANKAASAQQQAADIQSDAIKEAARIQREIYQQRRADLAPYLAFGTGALGKLSDLMGLPVSTAPQTTYSGQVTTPGGTGIPLSSQTAKFGLPNATFISDTDIKNAPAPRGYSTIKAPNGSTYYIPPEKVAEAITQGGKLVS